MDNNRHKPREKAGDKSDPRFHARCESLNRDVMDKNLAFRQAGDNGDSYHLTRKTPESHNAGDC